MQDSELKKLKATQDALLTKIDELTKIYILAMINLVKRTVRVIFTGFLRLRG